MATIFYSWQSDSPSATNRGFIFDALRDAAHELGDDPGIEQRPEVDHDTAGVAGSPNISATIFAKIDRADVFVCDVSIITRDLGSERAAPNPNVLVELGYAIKSLGWERIVLVMNTARVGPEVLPFDIRNHRVAAYKQLASPEQPRATERRKLQATLRDALGAVLRGHPRAVSVAVPKPFELARDAITASAPDADVRARDFVRHLAATLMTEDQISAEVADEQLMRRLADTRNVVDEFTALADVSATRRNGDALVALFRGLEALAADYDLDDIGTSSVHRDLVRFIGHELVVNLVATCLKRDRLEMLDDVLREPVLFRENGRQTGYTFELFAMYVQLLETRNQRLALRRVSLHSDLLKERHETAGSAVSWEEFMEADIFLSLRTETREQPLYWKPWSMLYAKRVPTFLIRSERRSFAERVARALGLQGVDELRGGLDLARKRGRINDFWRRDVFWQNPLRHVELQNLGAHP